MVTWGKYDSTEYELEPGARLVTRAERFYLAMVENTRQLQAAFAELGRAYAGAAFQFVEACVALSSPPDRTETAIRSYRRRYGKKSRRRWQIPSRRL